MQFDKPIILKFVQDRIQPWSFGSCEVGFDKLSQLAELNGVQSPKVLYDSPTVNPDR